MAAAWPIHAIGDDHPDFPEWAREPVKWVRELKAEAEGLREALMLIRTHAALDLRDRGVAEAERYIGIADDALRRAALTTHPEEGER